MENKEKEYYDNFNKMVDEYDTIIYEMFIFMGAVIIYGILCQQWVFTVIFGLSVLGLYLITSKQIKQMKKPRD